MSRDIVGAEIEHLIQLLSRLPGLGPRSARRVALHLIKNRDKLLTPLASAMAEARDKVVTCSQCGNVDTADPCTICTDPRRDNGIICVVEEVGDLWALERAAAINGRYHVLGGVLSAIEGIGPDDLNIEGLIRRAAEPGVSEIVLAVNATVDGQTTAHYITERLKGLDVAVSRLAHGVPVGGELDYLDEGTLAAAFKARRPY
ncbi:recombination protein RecR [Kaustia mangrovi]|uniref:Recombination protein RecR n=1 Tax=Kaustia mangrovi TaxID=2593653 RepID=A0A7S8C5M2_9HYPH|nr:recombination mediator RecR [Kaustia mangrovi]QPC43847.1 recombination protein RecR [Kaustia mangrovi]